MDGVLLIDKPRGLTSHDVVAALRSASGERRAGHTGTLDPLATGLLPLVFGQATRLASLLTSGTKVYEATITLGQATDTDDADGKPVGEATSVSVSSERLEEALRRFHGTFEQVPPAHSAKKVGGRPAYELARREQPVALEPVPVTVHTLDLLDRTAAQVCVRMAVSPGFYVRALARDLGRLLGCGAHLSTLRRTAAGPFQVQEALGLAEAITMGPAVSTRLLSPAAALPGLPAVTVTGPGLERVRHGNPVGPPHLVRPSPAGPPAEVVKILTGDGRLAALGKWRGSLLHPVVVLG
jgi:tRNA pseudouridine55 synthase